MILHSPSAHFTGRWDDRSCTEETHGFICQKGTGTGRCCTETLPRGLASCSGRGQKESNIVPLFRGPRGPFRVMHPLGGQVALGGRLCVSRVRTPKVQHYGVFSSLCWPIKISLIRVVTGHPHPQWRPAVSLMSGFSWLSLIPGNGVKEAGPRLSPAPFPRRLLAEPIPGSSTPCPRH